MYCEREFAAAGLTTCWPQMNISFNERRGTVRGMHYLQPPHEESKLVRCQKGAILDVLIDLRSGSPTRGRHLAVELTEANRYALYVPPGFAHGFQTLCDCTEVFYLMGECYDAASARGLRWNDPAFGIKWPLPVSSISLKDTAYPDFEG
jgi:dTDP-4-dehydrorhamnose 3,5-epimerase